MSPNFSKASALLSSENQEAQKLFSLYIRDVEGAVISYRLFTEFKLKASQDTAMITNMIYHASCFVCASRRAARLLEALKSKRCNFRRPVADVIKQEWNKKQSFFDEVIHVRNAVEHINNEANNQTKLAFFNMHESTLEVTDEHSITIDDEALKKVISSREVIADAIISEYGRA